MSEIPLSTALETNEREVPAEVIADAKQHLGEEAAELTIEVATSDISDDIEKKTSSDTISLIDDYKAERGSVQGLWMNDLVERGFDPDTILKKLGNERLEEKLDIVSRGIVVRGTEQWKEMEGKEARYIPLNDKELDALMEAGANPQNIVDALQRTEPEDGVDNPNSVRIVERMDKLVEAGLPPAILAARLNPSWRDAVKGRLADLEVKWQEANRSKAVA